MDEVDAALDANYRMAIADAILEESHRSETQFIFTSFRREFCSVANRHFMVTMGGGTSKVDQVEPETAMALVNGEDEIVVVRE